MTDLGKILIITDVHGKIREMNQFFHYILEEKKEKIDFAIHLGDFWSGRNFEPSKNEQVRALFEDLDYLGNFPFPIYHIKGNEDLAHPQKWWNNPNTWLMRDQEPFFIQDWKVLPIHYHDFEANEEAPLKHPEFSEKDGFDIILSHRPPLGLLDDTLHYKTHSRLSNTGSPVIRKYYDAIKPSLFLFGHFHYSNFMEADYGLIACIDKLIRTGGRRGDQFRYSYGILDPFDCSLKVYWKNRLFFHYSILDQRLLEVHRFDRRNLHLKRRKKRID